jgi:hypothetical protein
MSTFKTQRSIARNIVLSPNSQLTYAEVMADADLTYRGRPETSAFLQWMGEYESDLTYAGKNGKSTATEDRLITEQSSGEISTRLDDFLAGWAFAFLMGKEVYTAGVNPAPNTHLFTFNDDGNPKLLTNVYVEDTTALKQKWSDMAVSQVVVSGTDKGSITVKISLVGLGTVTIGAMAALPALPTAQYLYGSDSTVAIGPIGAPASMSPRVLSWEATFGDSSELFRATGGGTKPYFVKPGNVVNKLKLTIAADDTADVWNWRLNQTPLEVKITAASGAASMVIDYVNVNLPQVTMGDHNKLVAYTVDLDENNIKQPAAGGDAVTVTVENTDTAYLVDA